MPDYEMSMVTYWYPGNCKSHSRKPTRILENKFAIDGNSISCLVIIDWPHLRTTIHISISIYLSIFISKIIYGQELDQAGKIVDIGSKIAILISFLILSKKIILWLIMLHFNLISLIYSIVGIFWLILPNFGMFL